jgi:hypothetical protein
MRAMIKYRWSLAAIALMFGTLAGCQSGRTETGYQPRRLGMSAGALRSLYAPAFSPEAQAAENEKHDQTQIHRPGY